MRRISCFFVCCSLVSFVVAPPPPTEQPVAQAAAPNVDSPVNENRAQQQEAVPVAPHQMQDENEQINRNFAQQPPPPPPQNIPNNNIPRFHPKNPRRPDGGVADTAPRVPKVQVDATEGTFSLAQNPACVKSIRDHCGPTDANMNNLNVLECFHNLQDNVNDIIDGQCLHEAWKVKLNFTQSDTFLKAADSLCAEEFQKLPCETVRSGRKGEFLACVIEHHEAIEKYPCKQFLVKLETIVFSDFHLISGFTDACGGSIERFQCGRITTKPEFSSQTHTIQCLTQSFDKLDDKCQHALLRVGELQGEDFHLDRGLFFACRDDRELLCHDVLSGEGRVYSCLMRFKNDPRMSEQCQKQIYRREQLVQRDYRVSKGLVKSCREDIKRYQCRKNTSDLKEVRLAQILLCLEAAMSDGNTVSGQCQAEILEHRRALLEPLGLSPELVVACDTEIRGTCAMDKQYKNKAPLECLMDLAAPSKHGFQRGAISDKCLREVETLLKEANAGEDWRVDPFVRKTCQPVVSEVCRDVQAGEGRVLQCLMQHLGSPAMTADCEESLLRLMYFVSRDFELDPKLYRNCRDDARLHCSARTRWGGETGTYDPEPGLVVLSCLYHIAVHPEDGVTLQHRCEEEVRRVMRTRGEKVDLHPEIEDYCMSDLAAYCSANVQRGQEIICLQDNMNKLSKDCREKIAELTIDEDRHAEDSPYMMKYCGAVAKEFCSEYMSEGAEEEDLMDCLIGHKSKTSEDHPKCYAAITHFQLITLEDVKFSRKFEVACAEDVAKFCYDGDAATDRAKTTEDIIECLSEVALEEALGENELEKTEKLHPKCKKQLMKQLRHEEENVDLNPRVKKICSADINKFCSGINKGSGRVVECLKEHFPDLEKPCKEVLFRTDTLGAREDRVDFSLTEHCHGMIERYKCDHRPLECLKKFKDEPDFDKKCHVVILRRMIEQSYDFRMNPELQEACKLDIGKFCARHLIGHTGKAPKILEGEVLSCLRDTLATKPQKLTETCKLQVQGVVENAAKDVRLNPHLMKVCKQTIGELCRGKSGAEVEECLKSALLSGDSNHHGIKDEKCKLEVVKIIAAEETDIHLDPILFGSCVAHIPVACPGVPRGEGRQLKCLLGVLDTNPNALSIECREKLKSRKAMFAYADSHVKSPESLIELRDIVFHSPASNFFVLFIVGFALFVFFGGLAFGRVTKQLRQELKNK